MDIRLKLSFWENILFLLQLRKKLGSYFSCRFYFLVAWNFPVKCWNLSWPAWHSSLSCHCDNLVSWHYLKCMGAVLVSHYNSWSHLEVSFPRKGRIKGMLWALLFKTLGLFELSWNTIWSSVLHSYCVWAPVPISPSSSCFCIFSQGDLVTHSSLYFSFSTYTDRH